MLHRIPRPSPALVVALVALFVALSGTAVAAGVVPLAKRAFVADNAKKLGGASLGQITGGIASAIPKAVPLLVSVKTQTWSLNGGGQGDFNAACPAGAKAIGGGFDAPNGTALALDTRPSSDGASWSIYLVDASSTAAASGSVYVVCLG